MQDRCHILTLALKGNYGGMLQAYALREAVRSLGVPADIFIHETPPVFSSPALRVMHYLLDAWRTALLYVGCAPRGMHSPWHLQLRNAARFRRSIGAERAALPLGKSPAADGARWIVGSDQVWRASMTRHGRGEAFYFLGGVSEEARRRSISYAASFGTDAWEGTPEETEECARLLRQFKAVSVRESSGVRLCQEAFDVSAVQMPDPTLLLLGADYEKLMEEEKASSDGEPYVAAYLLDKSAAVRARAEDVSARKKLPVRHLTPHVRARLRRDRFPLSVGQWLRALRNAECLVTDSFHGCVFAILFNKPFVCLGNEGRGSARFETLMSTFHLESRMLAKGTSAAELMEAPIDWAEVNSIHEAARERGLDFLKKNLLG